ncbi:MAG: exonuclease domain-containing protein [Aromatoleum sp.]|uniref:exonuclease domain-containing protein n=1 Tax=Aromatoleum sp. TaxID=2307007 RepID=UPI002895D91B|nr:exonuclease domain-containing protein [Aromatoleum sp.]MDT3670074.1 exonuclease domain-containing protein [Aromatoleum sp.]
MPLPDSLVLIDVETTGANPVSDRITEIAVLRIERGELVERWESLVNPGRGIPPLIQRLIGITDEMVAAAPTFAELADAVRARLAGAVFVAHNARFDYGFVRNEFSRLGQQFDAAVLCTVKLSRALYPEHHKHGLDALIARHGFHCEARHRAMGDTEVLWQFARKVRDEFPAEVLDRACERAMKAAPRPPGLPEGILEGLPDAPGVYSFFAENGQVLYIGRGGSLRARVTEHFSASAGGNSKDATLARKVRRVEWEEAAGDLAASLLETALVRAKHPSHNRAAPGREDVFGLRFVPNRRRPPIFERVALTDTDPASWQDIHGAFRHRKEADSVLRELAQHYRLCPQRLGLESGSNCACSAHLAKQCAGVCVGRESFAAHDERLIGALGSIRLRAWPWAGAVVIEERCAHSGREAFHLVDHWCVLGSVEDRGALDLLVADPPARRFDLDVYRILVRWLASDANIDAVRPLDPA